MNITILLSLILIGVPAEVQTSSAIMALLSKRQLPEPCSPERPIEAIWTKGKI